MKICTTCRRTYAEDTHFCLEDGAPLLGLEGQADLQTVVGPVPSAVDAPSSRPPPLPGRRAGGRGAAHASDELPHTAGTVAYGRLPDEFRAPTPGGARLAPGQVVARALAAAPDPAEAATFVASEEAADEEEGHSAYVGKLIDDRYLIVGLIGRGGMGVVYRCEQIHLRKSMAIKLLHESLVTKKQLISRFTREARAISRLSSPHTVMVYDFGRWGELFYLVMELLEGDALDVVIERDGPMPAARAVHVVLQMCDSLKEAHAHGIIHRDLKPENVMLVRAAAHADYVKILDFGLAKVEGVEDPYTIHSQRDIFGTPFYMSPEQIRAGEVDHRADLYAVGALLFRMLTGQHVFAERSTFDILKAHLSRPPPTMAEAAPERRVPPALEAIVARCLEKDPTRRFAGMAELATALEHARSSGFADAGLAPLPVATLHLPDDLFPPSAGAHPATAAGDSSPVDARAAPAAAGPAAVSGTAATTSAAGAGLVASAIAAAAVGAGAPVGPRTPSKRLAPESEAVVSDDVLQARAARSRWLRSAGFVGTLGVLLGGAALGLWAWTEGAAGNESEPNDTAREANPLSATGAARGVIGRRRSPQAADQDCYRLPAHSEGDVMTLHLRGVPNMDLQVALAGSDGEARSTWSHRGRGHGEELRHVELRGPLEAVCVTEFLAQGTVAGESLSDEYQLEVTVAAPAAATEREPNDGGRGNDMAPDTELRGTLDGPGDREVVALQGAVESRIVRLELDVAAGVPQAGARLSLVDASGRVLAALRLRAGDRTGTLAFATAPRQLPDRLVLERLAARDGGLVPQEAVDWTLRYSQQDLADQPESEPNNTAESAGAMVLGAWHTGHAGDAAGVDWLRIDGGDPAMQRIRIEALAPHGNGIGLLVRDMGSQVDLRQVQLGGGQPQELDLLVTGTGEGFLLRVQQLDGSTRRRIEPRYQLRARFASDDDGRSRGM
ncbi:MAG: serine/threonine protein kinase [Myxococcales bacterium]|nr:serine/threonine protein kinase [Myxococcales bacterium]